MPKITEAHAETRRTQILEAACKCFNDKGFHGTTVRDICRESGLSAGAVYGYFKSKAEIVEAMADMGRKNTRALFEDEGDAPPPSPAILLQKAIGLLGSDAARDSTRLDLRLWGEALHTPRLHDLFLQAFDNLAGPLADSIRGGQQRGEIASGLDPDATARVLAAICLGFEVQKAMDPDADFSGCAEVVTAMLEGSFVASW